MGGGGIDSYYIIYIYIKREKGKEKERERDRTIIGWQRKMAPDDGCATLATLFFFFSCRSFVASLFHPPPPPTLLGSLILVLPQVTQKKIYIYIPDRPAAAAATEATGEEAGRWSEGGDPAHGRIE